MDLSKEYNMVANNGHFFLVNISNGDIYEVNDVVKDLVDCLEKFDDVNRLAELIFDKYKNNSDEFSKEDMKHFIEDLISEGIIVR